MSRYTFKRDGLNFLFLTHKCESSYMHYLCKHYYDESLGTTQMVYQNVFLLST
jgi:hypothetical protein